MLVEIHYLVIDTPKGHPSIHFYRTKEELYKAYKETIEVAKALPNYYETICNSENEFFYATIEKEINTIQCYNKTIDAEVI